MINVPQNPNGQASSANSAPAVLSSEQEAKIDLLATKAKQDLLLAELQLKADLTETQPVSVSSLPLPTGAATETGNLAAIKAKTDNIPPLGQALAAASTPVVLTAAQLSTLTPPAAITGFATETTLTSVDGKIPALVGGRIPVVLPAGGSGLTDSELRATPVPMVLTSSATASVAGIKATMSAYGYLRATLEPKIQFADSFDGTVLDITEKWNQSGTVTLTNSSASIGNILTTSTVNNIRSQPVFPSLGLSFQVLAWVGSFEANPLSTTNVNRFYGFHTHTGTPTISQPATDGVGLEWDSINAKLWGAVYQGGVRSASSIDLSAYVTSANTRYAVIYRSDLVIFYIGTTEIPVGSISFVTPNTQNLPINFQTVIGASTPSTTPLNRVNAVAVGDTGGNASQISDGDSPFVKLNIKRANTLARTTDKGMVVRNAPMKKFRATFANVIASGADTTLFNTLQTGTGQTVAQSAGNLILTTGTTINSETIIRSLESFRDSLNLKYTTILSQRIINQNFFVELVDVIGDGLAITISSATSVIVTIPNTTFTSANVGQSMYLGGYSGTGTFVPGRYAIASVSGNNITFTVAGFAAGSGTCRVFGWNYHQVLYDSTTATNAKYDTQRRGWNLGFTTATINTSASPGHMGIVTNEDGNASYADQLTASATGLQSTLRATRVLNIPEENTDLFLQIRSVNGSTAPASTTTWTIGMVSVENYTPNPVSISNVKNQGTVTGMPVNVINTVPVSGTVTSNQGTAAAAAWLANPLIPVAVLTGDTGAKTATGNGATLINTTGKGISATINLGTVTGTTPTAVFKIQYSNDAGTTWLDLPNATTATIVATGVFGITVYPSITTAAGTPTSGSVALVNSIIPRTYRFVWTIGGTTPSFTITNIQVTYLL